jgi:hypothetical protein
MDMRMYYLFIVQIQQIMDIENMNKICFMQGDTGITTFDKKIVPDRFVGRWVTTDKIDTMYFITNDHFRLHDNYFSLYAYSYTSDSITIDYAGPDKIYVKPVTYHYNFDGDTLTMNVYKDFYWSIEKGIKKFLKVE